MSSPSKRTVPLVGSCRRTRSRPSVDLPQPDSPTMPSVSPRRTSSETPSTAWTTSRMPRRTEVDRTGKCLTRSTASSSTGVSPVDAHALSRSGSPLREAARSAGRTAGSRWHASRRPGADAFEQLRPGRAELEAVRAARREAAARRRGERRGRRPGNRREPADARPVDARDRAEQAPGVGVLGVAEDRGLRPLLDDAARVHHDDPLGEVGDDAHVVGDDQDRGAELALEALHQLEDLRLDRDVERRRRLVGDQERRVARERHRDHHALAHAARELVRIVVGALLRVRDPDRAEQLDRPLARLAPASASRAPGAARRSASRRCRPASAPSSGPGRSSRSRRRGSRASRRRRASSGRARGGAPRPRSRRSGRGSAASPPSPRRSCPSRTRRRSRAPRRRRSTARARRPRARTPSSVRNETRRSRTSSSGAAAQARRTRGSSPA